jgi:hypothetical protein
MRFSTPFVELLILFSLSLSSLGRVGKEMSTSNEWLARLKSATEKATDSQQPAQVHFESSGNGCSVAIQEHFDRTTDEDGNERLPDHRADVSFSLSDIDPFDIQVTALVTRSEVSFHTFNYVESIKTIDTGFPSDVRSSHDFYFIAPQGRDLSVDEEVDAAKQIANEFAEALKRAAEACGGKKSQSPLPDFVATLEVPAALSPPVGDVFVNQNERLSPRMNYSLCKEVSRDVKLVGSSFFQRSFFHANDVIYYVGTYPDAVFGKVSTASAQIKVLEVSDPKDPRCPPQDKEFATLVQRGPSYGWASDHRYFSVSNQSGSTAREYEVVDVNAEPGTDRVYCTHKFVINSATSDTGYKLIKWTPQSMMVSIGLKQNFGGPGPHIDATLYVKYVPRQDRDSFECTEPAPSDWDKYPYALEKRLPDGSIMFEPIHH